MICIYFYYVHCFNTHPTITVFCFFFIPSGISHSFTGFVAVYQSVRVTNDRSVIVCDYVVRYLFCTPLSLFTFSYTRLKYTLPAMLSIQRSTHAKWCRKVRTSGWKHCFMNSMFSIDKSATVFCIQISTKNSLEKRILHWNTQKKKRKRK